MMHPHKTGSEICSVLRPDQRSGGRLTWTISEKNIKEQSMPLFQGLSGLPEDSICQTTFVEVTVDNSNNSALSKMNIL